MNTAWFRDIAVYDVVNYRWRSSLDVEGILRLVDLSVIPAGLIVYLRWGTSLRFTVGQLVSMSSSIIHDLYAGFFGPWPGRRRIRLHPVRQRVLILPDRATFGHSTDVSVSVNLLWAGRARWVRFSTRHREVMSSNPRAVQETPWGKTQETLNL